MDVRVILVAMANALFEKKVALVANGPIANDQGILAQIKKYDRIVAVDGGLNHCARMGVIPDAFVGDLDSAKRSILKKNPQITLSLLPQDKDETDLEAALKEETEKDTFLCVFGAIGLRTDHTLGNILLLGRYPGNVWLETENEYLFVLPAKTTLRTTAGQTLSLLPLFGRVEGITTRGLKWELKDAFMDKSFFGISNVAKKSQIDIAVKKGDLLCAIQKNLREDFHEHPLQTIFSNR